MRYVLAMVLVLIAVAAAAQGEGQPAPCSAPEYRQFDFWLGNWTVTEGGKPSGKNQVSVVLDGCVVFEQWQGELGYAGKSFNRYDAASGQWEQTWVDNHGGVLKLSGGMQDGKMVLQGENEVKGKVSLNRITWTPNADGSVRQHWETSEDGGGTWTTVFDGLYRKSAEK